MNKENELKIEGSKHAFPHMHLDTRGMIDLRGGLSKRELFAAMAMQGYITAKLSFNTDIAAANAVVYADALLAELEKSRS